MSASPRRSARGPLALVATLVLGIIVTLLVMARPAGESVGSPSPTAAASATPPPSASASATAAASPTGTAASAVRPDNAHGFLTITPSAIRTEASSSAVASLSADYSAAVSPDGKRVAMIRASQTGQQLITFDTTRPARQTVVVDLAGSAENALGALAWAGDNSASVLFAAAKTRAGPSIDPPAEYSALRSVDLVTGAVREELRLTDGAYLVPVAWQPRTRTAVAVTTGAGGFASDYVLVRPGGTSRTAFPRGAVVASSVSATHDGARILASQGATNTERVLRWWPFDRFDAQQELRPPAGEAVVAAAWRPGSDEIGVALLPVTVLPSTGAPRLELWSTGGARRVVGQSVPFAMFRHDGTAAITRTLGLIDLATGALTQLPTAGQNESPVIAVLF